MSELPYMPLWVNDYRGKTGHLTALEHGIYLLLIIHYWQTGSLPDDETRLARIACTTAAEWRKSRKIIEKFFEPGWKHERVELELEIARKAHNKRVEAGRKGGIASSNAGSNAQAMLKQSHSEPYSHLKAKEVKTFGNLGSQKANGWSPPRHGATGKGRVYIEKGSAEWGQYAEDWRSVHGTDPTPNDHGGKWFKTLGEKSIG